MFVGFLWAVLASHLKAVSPDDASGFEDAFDDAPGLLYANLVFAFLFLLASFTGQGATGISLFMGAAVLAVNIILITVKWAYRSARARSSPNP